MLHSTGTQERPGPAASRPDPLHVEVKLCNLPPFPAAATKLLQISSLESVELRVIYTILASDPATAAEVLRLANSALFDFTTEIHSVQHAVMLLGFERVRSLAVAIGMKSYWAASHPAHRQCWAHSVACAVLAEKLADFSFVRNEDAFTAGLLHDIGRMGLLKVYGREYAPLMAAEYDGLDDNLTAERWTLQMDHCVSGSWLARSWSFPMALQQVTEKHHEASAPEEGTLLSLIQACCRLADALGFPEVNCRHKLEPEAVLPRLPEAAQRKVREDGSRMVKEISDRINYLES